MNPKLTLLLIIFTSTILSLGCDAKKRYEANWSSLDSRPLPAWYDEAKVGIFMHWGVYSVPSFNGGERFWQLWKGEKKSDLVNFMEKNYRPGFQYTDFASQFTAEFFDAEQWMELFESFGAKYIVFTSKHLDGFSNWPSLTSPRWNSVDTGPQRDLVGELANAVKKRDGKIKFGLLYSLGEWNHPLWLEDKANNFKTQNFVAQKTSPDLYDLVRTYRPDVLFPINHWSAPTSYWNSTNFLAWLFNDSPVKDSVVVNDVWGRGTECNHGSYYNHDCYTAKPSHLRHKWEKHLSMDRKSYGYRRNADLTDYRSTAELLQALVEAISRGGNFLLNVGPTKEGTIPIVMQQRLSEMGAWLKVNGEAVYGTRPADPSKDTLTSGVWYTRKGDAVYAFVLDWPADFVLKVGSISPKKATKITMLADPKQRPLKWRKGRKEKNGLVWIKLIGPDRIPGLQLPLVLKFTNL